ncbi:MAG: TIGR02171 family protein [Fibrobacter sp.]|nr:TIGR02171 family protein [Fibrobacter sp.]
MSKKSLLFLLLFCFLAACSSESSNSSPSENENSSSSETEDVEVIIDGMIHLTSGTTSIGSDDAEFKANERPAMQVKIEYDFYMGKSEVTCGEYSAIAKKTDIKTFGNCENDSLPITDLTYYDAVLFANAKSKVQGYDTVYSYTKAIFDSEDHCTNLEGIHFHTDVNGFRLPTEAEWVYAATKNWDIQKAWYSDNSDFKLHSVCRFSSDSTHNDSTEFCDMAGNAMEWVNDWLGAFRDTTVSNYAGAPNSGDLDERVVKGGYYSSSKAELNPYSRGDVYTVTSSTRAEYVGFRLAFGSISNPLWMADDGSSVTSVITPLANTETIKNLIGTYKAKLVFRNDLTGDISLLDYKNGSLSVQNISSGIQAFHPEISPDGNWVAYCTGLEGISGKSKLYVQSLESSQAILLDVESAAIPRWRVLESGDTVIVYVTDAGNNKEDATFQKNSTWQVPFTNGNFGTPEKIFTGAYHGGISEDRNLAVSGSRVLRARIQGKDTIWYAGEQACNVSMVMDGSKRTSFLDFGGETGKKFVGSSYSTHQRILIADSTGKLLQSVKAPSGYTFDHSEWATDGKNSLIITTLTNDNGAHTKIALVNLQDSSVTEIMEGEELWHPNLWIQKVKIIKQDTLSQDTTASDTTASDTVISEIPFELDPDSAGIYYNTSGAYSRAAAFRYKMEILWQYKDSANVVVLGSSHTYLGVNPLIFKDPYFAVNLAIGGATIQSNSSLFLNYILPHYKNLKYVILSIDIDRGSIEGVGNNNLFHEAYKSYPGYVYDQNHNYWKDGYPEGLSEATYDSPGPASTAKSHRATRGFFSESAKGWGNPYIANDSNWLDTYYDRYQTNLQTLKNFIQTCNENSIHIIGIITPQNPKYANTGAFGRSGLRRSEAPALIQEIADLSKDYPYFTLLDENKMGAHDYTDDMAKDTDHLSEAGAAQLTNRLDSLLRTLE